MPVVYVLRGESDDIRILADVYSSYMAARRAAERWKLTMWTVHEATVDSGEGTSTLLATESGPL